MKEKERVLRAETIGRGSIYILVQQFTRKERVAPDTSCCDWFDMKILPVSCCQNIDNDFVYPESH